MKKYLAIVGIAIVSFISYWVGQFVGYIRTCRARMNSPEQFDQELDRGCEAVSHLDELVSELKTTIKGEET